MHILSEIKRVPRELRPLRHPPIYLVARLLAHLQHLNGVAVLQVVEGTEPNTALVSLANLSDVVLKATERFNREVVTNHNALTQNACLGVAADFARAHDRTRNVEIGR